MVMKTWGLITYGDWLYMGVFSNWKAFSFLYYFHSNTLLRAESFNFYLAWPPTYFPYIIHFLVALLPVVSATLISRNMAVSFHPVVLLQRMHFQKFSEQDGSYQKIIYSPWTVFKRNIQVV